ncbi:hypothetical protein H0H81_012061 [Sphagnurus paluster]|uniref:Domain of unknown function at the cortex 1 domain-containing protein n=1 Tax=Sphagnurus paluster TaxID=117069 RepID=A0A9P7KJ77_9AGAR|nr:hypothetical protein H0H81_012061 [Sphagnurus paluster]
MAPASDSPPRLRVLAGTSAQPDALTPIRTGHTVRLASLRFEGELVVHIKGLDDGDGQGQGTSRSEEYFARPERVGVTWSIQVRGRFLQPVSADDVLFGNTFDRPLGLPWGSGAALKFMNYIDPTLEHDLTSQTKPWALSPLVATMPHLVHTRVPSYAPSSVASSPRSSLSRSESPSPSPENNYHQADKQQEESIGEEDKLNDLLTPRKSTFDDLITPRKSTFAVPPPPPLARRNDTITPANASTHYTYHTNADATEPNRDLDPDVDADTDTFPPRIPISDDTSQLHLARRGTGSSGNTSNASSASLASASSSSSSGGSYASAASSFRSGSGSSLSVHSQSGSVSEAGSGKNGKGGGMKKLAARVRKGKGGRKKDEEDGVAESRALGLETAAQRRAYFSSAAHRQEIVFGPQDVVTTDFCYGFLEFSPRLALRLPGGLSFDLMRYWDGQPVRFVCCERGPGSGAGGQEGVEGDPWGEVYWCVVIEMGE